MSKQSKKDKFNQAVARRVIDQLLSKGSDRTANDECSQNALTELRAAAQDALESIVEWRNEEFVIGTESLEKRLRDAIAESEGL